MWRSDWGNTPTYVVLSHHLHLGDSSIGILGLTKTCIPVPRKPEKNAN